jgi:hypothetical protein
MTMESSHLGLKTLNTLHASYEHLLPEEQLDKQHLQTAELSGPHYLQPLLINN